MPVGVRFSGAAPGVGSLPPTAMPGQSAPSGPIADRIQRDAQADAVWSQPVQPGGVQNILAANAQRNQQAVSNGAMGYGTSGLGYSQGAITPIAGCEFQAPQKCLRLIKVYAINFIP